MCASQAIQNCYSVCMPRLLDSTRQHRIDAIADAAMTCFLQRGFAGTSMSDIISASGASAGAIYSHFASKIELAHYVAARLLRTQAEDLDTALQSAASGYLTPRDVIERLLTSDSITRQWSQLLLQIWAEATNDAALAAMVTDHLTALRTLLVDTLLPWAVATNGTVEPHELAGRCADALLAVAHGAATRVALDSEANLSNLLVGLTKLFPVSDSSH